MEDDGAVDDDDVEDDDNDDDDDDDEDVEEGAGDTVNEGERTLLLELERDKDVLTGPGSMKRGDWVTKRERANSIMNS